MTGGFYSDLPAWVYEHDPHPGADLRWPMLVADGALDLVTEAKYAVYYGPVLQYGPTTLHRAERVAAALAQRYGARLLSPVLRGDLSVRAVSE